MVSRNTLFRKRRQTLDGLAGDGKLRLSQTAARSLSLLSAMVLRRAAAEGRTDAPFAGLRYYRFCKLTRFTKTQVLMPGLVVVLQGRKRASFGGRRLAYDPLHYLVLTHAAVCESTVVEASRRQPYLAIALDLPVESLARTLLAVADAKRAPTSGSDVFVAPLDPSIVDALVRLLRAVDDPLDRRILAPLIVEEIVFRLLRSEAAAALRAAIDRSGETIKIQDAMRFMRANFNRNLSVPQLARHVAMSPSHFAHRFSAVARVSPMRYLRQVRLEQARTLLLAGPTRAGQVAAAVGFESAAHFSREFKNAFGTAPAQFARNRFG
jgi:AraC-like DNA-binding protein